MASGVFRGSTGRTLKTRSLLVAISLTATIASCGVGLHNGSPAIAHADPPDSSQTVVLPFAAIVFPRGELAGAERRNGRFCDESVGDAIICGKG
jgi:hypothetical protein